MTVPNKIKEKYLAYYYDMLELDSKTPIADTLKKYKKLRRSTLNSWIKQGRNSESHTEASESPESPIKENAPTIKKDTTDTFTEIVAEKKLDEQFNEEHWNMIESPRVEGILKYMEEKYPKKAKELLTTNFKNAVELTFDNLEKGVPTKDIADLREGASLNEVLDNNRKPLTIDDKITHERKEQAYKFAQMDNMWTGDQLERSKEALEVSTFQTNNEQKFFDGEMMSFLKEYFSIQSILRSLPPQQQLYLKQKFMMEKALFIFPLIGEILYSNSDGCQELELTEEEVDKWFNKQPIEKREFFLKEIRNIKMR